MADGAAHSDDAANVSAISIAGFMLRFRMTWFLKRRRDASQLCRVLFRFA
jgi:hypothetical protein